MSQYRLTDTAKQLAQELYRLHQEGKIQTSFSLIFMQVGSQPKIIMHSDIEAVDGLIPNQLTTGSLEQLMHSSLIGQTRDERYVILPSLLDAVENNFQRPEDKPNINIQTGDGANIVFSVNGNVSQTIITDSQKLADEFTARFGEEILKQHEPLKQIIHEMRQAVDETQRRGFIARVFDYVAGAADITGLVGFGLALGELLKR